MHSKQKQYMSKLDEVDDNAQQADCSRLHHTPARNSTQQHTAEPAAHAGTGSTHWPTSAHGRHTNISCTWAQQRSNWHVAAHSSTSNRQLPAAHLTPSLLPPHQLLHNTLLQLAGLQWAPWQGAKHICMAGKQKCIMPKLGDPGCIARPGGSDAPLDGPCCCISSLAMLPRTWQRTPGCNPVMGT